MNIIYLSKLNEHRHPDNPVPRRTLLHQAERGILPGAFQPAPGSSWKIDLDTYDQAIKDLIEANRLDNRKDVSEQTENAIIDEIYEEFCRAGQANH